MTKHLLITAMALAMTFGTADMSFAKSHNGGGGDHGGIDAGKNHEAHFVLDTRVPPSGGGTAGSEGPPEGHSLYCQEVLKMPRDYAAATVHACQLPSVTG